MYYVFSANIDTGKIVAIIRQRRPTPKQETEKVAKWQLNFYDTQLGALENLMLVAIVVFVVSHVI